MDALVEWPLLDPIRSTPAFRKVLSSNYQTVCGRNPSLARRLAEARLATNGDRYHHASCRHAKPTMIGVPLRTAKVMGLVPCGSCKEDASR
jgi:hypothetical protein